MNSTPKFPIGKSDFQSIREGNYEYVDKSLLISDLLQSSAEVLLFPRPRRFGKTLNLSMLKYFFEKTKEKRRQLFSGLLIEQKKEAFTHFQKYPVIFLTLKDVKANTWEESFQAIKGVLARLYEEHRYLLESSLLSPEQKAGYQHILAQVAQPAQYFRVLFDLSEFLNKYHQEKVVILIDEYDTCLHEAYHYGYAEEALSFFRNFLSGGLKDNPYLFKGVLTGILRIARESLFSGLNNLAVYSLLQSEFAAHFGFTEEEVETLTKEVGLQKLLPDLKRWYNGYVFGKQVNIYNPFSLMHFLASQDHEFQAYWVNTSSDKLLRELLFESSLPLREDLEVLLQGGSIDKPLYENTVFSDLEKPGQAVWSFLLFCGYLTAESLYEKNNQVYGTLRLVNREIYRAFSMMIQVWFENHIGYAVTVDTLLKGLLSGHAEVVEKALRELLKLMVSYHDVPGEEKEKNLQTASTSPKKGKKDVESVYHMFTLGLLANLLSDYHVHSNSESGDGRADGLLIPRQKGKLGVALEFKVAGKEEQLQAAVEKALKQLKEKEYDTQLKEHGATHIYQYGVAFSGKHVMVKLLSQSDSAS